MKFLAPAEQLCIRTPLIKLCLTSNFGVAVILGSITETLGAVILSGGVVSGISGSSSIVNIKEYQSSSNETEFGKFQVG